MNTEQTSEDIFTYNENYVVCFSPMWEEIP